jgi:hypothetical protein
VLVRGDGDHIGGCWRDGSGQCRVIDGTTADAWPGTTTSASMAWMACSIWQTASPARATANDSDALLARVAPRCGTGLARVLMAGIIEPVAGPHVLADTPAKAIKFVDWYADHGYRQIRSTRRCLSWFR